MNPIDIFQRFMQYLDQQLTGYWTSLASNLIAAITPVATSLMIIYVILWGWTVVRGTISEPVLDGVQRIVRLALITGIALNIGHYSGFLATWLYQSPEALASSITGAASSSSPQFLDNALNQYWKLGNRFYRHATSGTGIIPDFGLLVTGFLCWTAGIFLTAYAFFLIALAKVAMTILLCLGPLFVLMLIFEPTKRYFDVWLGQCITYLLVVVLVAIISNLILTLITRYMDAAIAIADAVETPSIIHAIPALVFAAIGFLVLLQVTTIASSLGSGMAVGTLGAVGYGYRRITGGVSALRPRNVQHGINKLKSDGRVIRNAYRGVAAYDRKVSGMPAAAARRMAGGLQKNAIAKSSG